MTASRSATRPSTRPSTRAIALLLLVLTLSALLLPPQAAHAATSTAEANAEAEFLKRINNARTSRGLRPLKMYGDLRGLARDHSQAMMLTDTLFHSADLGTKILGERRWGENVGYGYSVGDIHKMLMNSPGHRANILSKYYRHAGIGVQIAPSGKIWVTQVFRQPL